MENNRTTFNVILSWFSYALACFFISLICLYFLFSAKSESIATKITMETPETLKPDGEIIINFSKPIKTETIKQTLKITPSISGKILWNDSFTSLKFIPKETMEPGRKYILAFQGENYLLVPFKFAEEFQIEPDPKVEKVAPFKEQGVAMDEKIFVNFDRGAKDYEIKFQVGIIPNIPEENQEESIEEAQNEKSNDEDEASGQNEIASSQINADFFKTPNQNKDESQKKETTAPEFLELIEFETFTDDEKKQFVLTPKQALAIDKKYKVEVYSKYISDKKTPNFKPIKEFSFATLKPLQLLSTTPQFGAKNVLTNQKIVFNFDKPIEKDSFRESVEITTPIPFQIEFSDDPKQAIIKPEKFKQDTEYTVIIKRGLKALDQTYLEEDQILKFKTENFGGFVNDGRTPTDDPYIKEGKYIDINLSKQLLGIYNDGELLGAYIISSGRSGMNTPTGTFHIMRKETNHWSNQYKLWMPYSLQFTGRGHFIHELPEWPSGYKEGANHLGIPVSHGCVRLGVGPAENVFNFSEVKTPIYIHY
jgi:lipoprotein-anchoring transpeptidase ErfK/SrfK